MNTQTAMVINLDEVTHTELDMSFMRDEFDRDKLVEIGDEGLTVLFNGEALPFNYRTMKTDTEYIFRIIPQGFDDGFNIYRVKRP